MAGKKGRSGRKKKAVKKAASKALVKTLQPLPMVELQPEKVEEPRVENLAPTPSLMEKMKTTITNLLPKNPTETHSSESTDDDSAPAEASASAEFEVLAAKLEEKYGAGDSTPAPPPTAASPLSIHPGTGHVITPSTVERFIVMVLNGMAKAHGNHWQPTQEDTDVLVPVYTAAIDEQAPRWFADSENKALWICALTTIIFVVSRSKSGGKVIEWGMEKMATLVSRAGATTKTA
jgi:hypothetical protein